MPVPLFRAIGVLEAAAEDPNTVVHLRDKFSPSTPDVSWIRTLAEEREWIIISADYRITKNPANRKAWKESGLQGFFLKPGWAEQKLWLYASRFIGWWPNIVAAAKVMPKGSSFLVPFRGTKFETLNL